MTTPNDEPTNVLVVDDLPEKLLVYRTILGELNLNLITASSGEDALRAVLAYDLAVILLDVNMPGMNGLETAALIRQRKRSAHTPIIFLTAFPDEVRAAEGYAHGGVDYITTPVVPGVLRAKVRVFVDLYRMTQQIRQQAEERIALAAERTRREAAEEANRRLVFLAHAGAVLGGSLDQQVTANATVRLALDIPADAAVLVILATSSRSEIVVSASATPEGSVIETTDRATLDPALTNAIELAAGGNEPVTGPESILAVPLGARGRVFAVLALSRESSGRVFATADVTLAETFVSRAAMALENARLYHELQQADQQKNEFLSMLAHELRNPLAPLRNANEVLRLTEHEPARVRWAQGVINRQLTHLVRLVDDLLDVSRLTLGKIRLAVELVDLESVLTHAIEAVRPLLDQARHQFEVILPPRSVWVQGDPTRLSQVFANLLNNAAKYTEPGGRIWLRVNPQSARRNAESRPDTGPGNSDCTTECRNPRTPMVEVSIRDTGVGIAPDQLQNVFALFIQVNSSLDRSQGGLGIGLTLVKRLVEMHGGTVEARSAGPGCGSEFVVRLPMAPLPEAETDTHPAALHAGGAGEPLRVVVVDDNEDGAESLADLIRLLGHEVRVAHDGPTGLQTVRDFDPDLVLLDIGLPGMDGYEVARQIPRDPPNGMILVAVSGYGREEDRTNSREAGFEHHFVKPIEFEALRGLLERVRAMRVRT